MSKESEIAVKQARIQLLESRIAQADSLGYTDAAVAQMQAEINRLKLEIGMRTATAF